ncbi:inositol oxygenase family protein [Rhizobium sp. FKY42]|uniref:inositol oxygenase family protein n=1 Tax=Rhizobium sp. FKY42 TaxID=2562310 RepID=UPI0010BFA478|nr:inositol oxygenase family protein [Rhizobium sp. FKY42]
MNSRIETVSTTSEGLTKNVFGSSDPLFRKEPGEYMTADEQAVWRIAYEDRAKTLYQGHFRQSPEIASELRRKYERPIFGRVKIIDVLRRLGECVDPTDTELYLVNQLIHTLQVACGMEEDGIEDETMILAALVHDLGKVTELAGEKPEYVNGPNEPIGLNVPGCGLDNVLTTWNHDEFAWQRVREYVPDHVAWLVRYHSLRFGMCHQFMDERDWSYHDKYLGVFRKYDLGTKSIFQLPKKRLDDFMPILDKYFPEPIEI